MTLQRAFAQSDWTYTALGERCGFSRVSAYRKLNGLQPINLEELQLLEDLLGLEVSVSVKKAAS